MQRQTSMRKLILISFPWLLLLLSAELSAQVATDPYAEDKYGIGNPRATVARHLYYLNEGKNPEKSAQALFKEPITQEHIELAIKLKQIYDVAGANVRKDAIPDEPDYRDSTLDAHRYIIFPKKFPELYVQRQLDKSATSPPHLCLEVFKSKHSLD